MTPIKLSEVTSCLQADSSPEKDSRQGFVPVQASVSSTARQNCYTHHPSRDSGLR